jgi:hypothetical protein
MTVDAHPGALAVALDERRTYARRHDAHEVHAEENDDPQNQQCHDIHLCCLNFYPIA